MEKLKAEAKQAAALPVENLVETQPWRQQRKLWIAWTRPPLVS